MLITLTQLKKSLQALKDFLLAKITVKDVQINGTSVLDEGVANVPIASTNILGVVKSSGEGIQINSSTGDIYTQKANPDDVKAGTNRYKVIVPQNQNEATFYGLAKASGDTTQSASSNPVGTYTDDAKTSIKTMLGVEDPVDVQINGTSIVDNGVANIPVASSSDLGLVKVGSGLSIFSGNQQLIIVKGTDAEIKAGKHNYDPIVPSQQHKSVFYGLAKAAGDTTQSASSNPVGTYTDEAKTSIKSMLGVEELDVQINGTSIVDNGVANIPKASASSAGVISASSAYGIGLNVQGGAYISGAASSEIKKGTSPYKPVTVSGQHQAAFYGLAKAAGDTTQSASSNAVGTYTDEAKSAIKTMLGIDTITVDSIPTTEIDTLFA